MLQLRQNTSSYLCMEIVCSLFTGECRDTKETNRSIFYFAFRYTTLCGGGRRIMNLLFSMTLEKKWRGTDTTNCKSFVN